MKELKECQRRLTYKGGVIIPVEIRRLLGIKPQGEVRFRVADNKRVELLQPAMTLEEAFASVRPKRRPLDFKKMRDTAIQEHVQKVARKLKT